ncbi:hypothetical protein F5X71_31560 [Nocardia brasiliensis]|uniref:Uncharacterized protein n=1 Tax=Nocardia brasiliensis TaxID=37326 RepID=A0A6G9XZ72_NOCBR|nr:hypothetical protein [Nocardia brasiliensis]QIS06239.1 hypothetical protein F5X71_31560 [Nocardia brasiliensis]
MSSPPAPGSAVPCSFFGILGTLGGFAGLASAQLLKKRSDSTIRIWFATLLIIGLVTFGAFLILNIGRDSADIGIGFLLMFALILGLPGLFGTLASFCMRRRA